MATWCLTKDLTKRFKEGLRSGEIDPQKMARMDSATRRKFLEGFVGKENAVNVNSLFESKLLLKNQQAGMISWAKKVAGITPTVRRDLISRIEKMDNILSPAEGEQFMQDLASTRLRIDVTAEEAKTISDLANKALELKSKADVDGKFQTETERFAYGIARVNLENYVNDLKLQSKRIFFREEPLKKITNAIKTTPGVMKSLMASLDNSFWGRQGIKTLADPRTSKIWAKNFLKSWADIGKELKGVDAINAIKADIYSRPNSLNSKYDVGGYGLGVLTEEAFPSSLPEKIPVLGRLFKASEAAYNGAALRLRADLADRLIDMAEKQGVNTLNKAEAQHIGKLVRSITGRASLGKVEPVADTINALLFSPRYLMSNINTLIAPAKYALGKAKLRKVENEGQAFSEKEAAKNSVLMVTTLAGLLAISKLLDPESVDEDPRSTNFGKIKIFNRWTDITGGVASLATLVARIATGKSKSSTGKWTDLRSGGFGQRNALDVFVDFGEGKLSPILGAFADILQNETFEGEKPTLENLLPNLTLPLSVQTFSKLKEDGSSSNVLGSMILEGLGLGGSSYKFKDNWEKSDSVKIEKFKEKIGDDNFKKANEDFNRTYNEWFNSVSEKEEYKSLSDDSKATLQTQAKEDIKNKLFEEYGFKYKTPEKTEEQKRETEEMKKLLPKEISEGKTKDALAKISDAIGGLLTAFSSVASASGEGKRVTNLLIRPNENSVTFMFEDEKGNYSEKTQSLDYDDSVFAGLGGALAGIGEKLGLPELKLSELLGYKSQDEKIIALQQQYNYLLEQSKASVNVIQTEVKEINQNPEPKREGNYVDIIEKYFGNETDNALKTLQNENARQNPRAENKNSNGTVDRGVFQINSMHFFNPIEWNRLKAKYKKLGIDTSSQEAAWEQMYDPEKNIAVAKLLWDEQGWDRWYGAPDSIISSKEAKRRQGLRIGIRD